MGVYIGQTKYTGGPADASTLAIPKSVGQAAGYLIYFTGASVPVRLPIGSNGQVLTLSGGVPSWQTPSGGGGGSSTLAGLSDTIISQNPVNKQALIYDSTSSKWINSYIIWDQNMHATDWEIASSISNPDGSDQGQPCVVNFITDSSRRNIWFMGWSGTIIPEANADGPNGEHFFYLSFNAVVSTDDGPVDHYLVILNESGEDVILSIERLQCNGFDVDRAIVQSINNSYLPALPDGEAAILCYTVGAIPSVGNTVGIVSWGGNFTVQ